MSSSFTRSPLSPSPPSSFLTKPPTSIASNPSNLQLNPPKTISKILRHAFDPTSKNPNKNHRRFSPSCLTITQPLSPTVSEKVQSLNFEFKSLPKPIDRVKRLLHYAAILPPFNELSRIQENRVFGCTTQVWLEVTMDRNGAMRFRVDSDSEITKGFCSCLIWVLDGADADEVLSLRSDDLVEMNVGLPSNSRVNTWQNVLISLQRRTKDLAEERERETLKHHHHHHQSLDDVSSLVGSLKETLSGFGIASRVAVSSHLK